MREPYFLSDGFPEDAPVSRGAPRIPRIRREEPVHPLAALGVFLLLCAGGWALVILVGQWIARLVHG